MAREKQSNAIGYSYKAHWKRDQKQAQSDYNEGWAEYGECSSILVPS